MRVFQAAVLAALIATPVMADIWPPNGHGPPRAQLGGHYPPRHPEIIEDIGPPPPHRRREIHHHGGGRDHDGDYRPRRHDLPPAPHRERY